MEPFVLLNYAFVAVVFSLLLGATVGLLTAALSPDRAMGEWYLHPGLLIPPVGSRAVASLRQLSP